MFIRSERLFLRPGWPEDWSELLSAINDEGVVCNLVNAPWPYTMDDAMAFAQRPQERLLPHFFVTVPTSDGAKLIGSAGLARRGDDVELGYWIARDFWGRGYASEAVRALLRLAKTLGHQRIVASHFTDNPASGRVLTKAGFLPCGSLDVRRSEGRRTDALCLNYAIDFTSAYDCDAPALEEVMKIRVA